MVGAVVGASEHYAVLVLNEPKDSLFKEDALPWNATEEQVVKIGSGNDRLKVTDTVVGVFLSK